jgi:hypothetical protein
MSSGLDMQRFGVGEYSNEDSPKLSLSSVERYTQIF